MPAIAAKTTGNQTPSPYDADIDLLRRVDEAEQRAEDRGRRQRVAERDAVGEHDAETVGDGAHVKRAAVFGCSVSGSRSAAQMVKASAISAIDHEDHHAIRKTA